VPPQAAFDTQFRSFRQAYRPMLVRSRLYPAQLR
jgi:hypothetical protein